MSLPFYRMLPPENDNDNVEFNVLDTECQIQSRSNEWGSWTHAYEAAYISILNGFLRSRRWILPSTMLGCAILYEVAASYIMTVIGDFYLAVSSQNWSLFLSILWKSVIIVAVVSTLKASRDFTCEACSLQWRCNLVQCLHLNYLKDGIPYEINSCSRSNKPIDNPDQRIVADADNFASSIGEVFQKALVVPGLLIYYTWYLWKLFGWVAPVTCYVYFFFAASINSVLLRRIVPLEFESEKCEGSFRYAHAQLRLNSEPVAFFGPTAIQNTEKQRLESYFDDAVRARWQVIRAHLPLYCGIQFFNYFGSIVNYAAVGASIFYFTSTRTTSESEIASLLARGSFSCLYIINAFSMALDASEALTRVRASAGRVMELLYGTGFTYANIKDMSIWYSPSAYVQRIYCQERKSSFQDSSMASGSSRTQPKTLLKVENVTISLPSSQENANSKDLIRNLTFSVQEGNHVLITGPSGCGKSSLLRTIAGLWEKSGGFIEIQNKPLQEDFLQSGIMFLPQMPYIFLGTLADLVVYPLHPNITSQTKESLFFIVEEILQSLQLTHLLSPNVKSLENGKDSHSGIERIVDWGSMLSHGEQQRIGFARALYHHPKLLVLDESTSALREDMQADIITLVQAKGMTLLSVGHRESLKAFHHHELKILQNESCGWEFKSLENGVDKCL